LLRKRARRIIFIIKLSIFIENMKYITSFTPETESMNTMAYLIYIFLTYIITVHVGFRFYRNGRVFLLSLLNNDALLTGYINKALLVGYYLLNLGYAAVMLRFWSTVRSWPQLVASVCRMTGAILLTLAIIHFFNMLAIFLYSRRQSSLHSKTSL
jgi:hypothetical protein